MKLKLLILFCCIFSGTVNAQSLFEKTKSGKYEQTTLYELFGELEKSYNFKVCCDPNKLPWYNVNCTFSNKTIHEVFKSILPKNGLSYTVLDENTIAICKTDDLNRDYLIELQKKCAEGTIKLPEFLSPYDIEKELGSPNDKIQNLNLEILVKDDDTNDAIPGAVVLLNGTPVGNATNNIGKTNIKLKSGKNLLAVRYIGFRETRLTLQCWESGEISIPIKANPLALQEVLIEGNRANNKVQNVQTAVEAMPVAVIKELPAFMGEADVVKSLSTLPGVTSAGDGSSGFNVRGGNIDQNLTMQDNATLFNTSHVLGFFSVYNPDLVRNVTLYKGHVPAKFGGRISSVLDVQLKDGNFTQFHGNIGIGIATGKAMIEGPILKNKISFIAGFRRSYSDWMLKAVPLKEGKTSSAWFFDGLTKISVRLSEKTSFNISTYGTNDYFRYGQQFGYSWANRLVNFSLKHPIGNTNIASVWQVNGGQYKGSYFAPIGFNAFELNSGLQYANAQWRLNWAMFDVHDMTAGVQWNRIKSLPENFAPLGTESIEVPKIAQKDKGEEMAIFIEDETKLTKRFAVSAGIRAVLYRALGEKLDYQYLPNAPRTLDNIVDSVFYGKGKVYKKYFGAEPRLSMSYKLSQKSVIKFSYNRMRQYVHLISNLSSPTPVDIWQVSNTHIAPQTGDNFDIGYSRQWAANMFELDADVFVKNAQNVPIYKDFPTLLLNSHLETELLAGDLKGIGAEVAVKKKFGLWTGWLSYTYISTKITPPNGFASEIINQGKPYPSDYDQPNQVNCYAKYSFNPAVSFALNYAYRSGRPASAPVSIYNIGGIAIPNYAYRNNVRIPDYHRLDISLNFDQNKSKISGAKTSFSLSIYNVLARQNPYSVFFKKEPDNIPTAYSLSLVGTAIPAFNWNITF
jgi:hypothetical protein